MSEENKENKQASYFEKIFSLIPQYNFGKILELGSIFYVTFTILGLINQFIFYKYFGINITEFLDYSEIIFILFDNILTITIRIIIGYGITLFSGLIVIALLLLVLGLAKVGELAWDKFYADEIEEGSFEDDEEDEDSSSNERKEKNELIGQWIALGILFILFSYLISIFKLDNGSILPYVIGFLLTFLTTKIHETIRNPLIIITVLITLVLFAFTDPTNEYKKVKSSSKEQNIVMTNGLEYNIGSNLKLIGSTKNFSFLYNSNENSSLVLKRSEISSVKIKSSTEYLTVKKSKK